METIACCAKQEVKVRKSNFYSYSFFVTKKQEVNQILLDLKKQHFAASHICYAYRLQENETFFCEDGEPFGCAGAAILQSILAKKLFYCLVVIVRYFGGIKFGKSLLRESYRNLADQILTQSDKKIINIGWQVQLEFGYEQTKQIEQLITKFHGLIVHKNFCELTIEYVVNFTNMEAISCLEK